MLAPVKTLPIVVLLAVDACMTAGITPRFRETDRGTVSVCPPLGRASRTTRGSTRATRCTRTPRCWEARGGARPARAAAAARRAAPDRARLGDAAAARARWLGGARRRARPAQRTRRSPSTATAAWRASRSTPDRPVGEVTRELLAAVRSLGGAVEIDPTPQEVPWTVPLDEDDEHATYDAEPGRDLPRGGDARRARARRVPRALPRALDAGQRVVGLVRPRGEPLLRRAGRPAVGRLHHAQRDGRPGGRRRLVAGRRALRQARRSTPTRTRRRRASRTRRSRRRPRAGTARSASTCSTGTTSSRAADPHATALEFARSAFRHACAVCEWDPALLASAEGTPPPVA